MTYIDFIIKLFCSIIPLVGYLSCFKAFSEHAGNSSSNC